ncbi:carbon-nitrogen family hydrolase [Limosilactobacillus sp.]|uniref:carbon-nitrogen family hydrolase n=1 Tax=Limosilactobacillus sp. TaxID=2773925 RepID=UPI0025C19B59|nr:carbon-nitrogen family hydrolase [Limosilactobacillus sp.]MCH3922156.1 carbon-nitrogen family hydrolase [Limosilactobacillus sp.]MCH3928927.1 carbon-nitrogen family hydrolase [Limosilactobacillus sp.]
MSLKVALAQIDIAFANPQANAAKVAAFTKQAAQGDADVVVFPEMWNTGYALDQLDQLADPDGAQTRELLSRLARQYQINIVGGSVATKHGDQFYNTTLVYDSTGQAVASYDKVHLFGLMKEDQYLTAGDRENFFRLAGVSSASFICYDLRFPEWIRTVARHGADILYLPAEWPAVRIPQWRIMLQARAIENQAFVVAVNRVGDDPDNHFDGHSLVIDPLGKIIVGDGSGEQLYFADLDLDELKAVRGPIPVFSDRRPDLYR